MLRSQESLAPGMNLTMARVLRRLARRRLAAAVPALLAALLGSAATAQPPSALPPDSVARAPVRASRPPVDPRRNVEEFPAVLAKFIRFTILETSEGDPCLDELEIYAANSPAGDIALASAGATATASGSLQGIPMHQLSHINDGLYGNERSWVADQLTNSWVQIELPGSAPVCKVVWSRDRHGLFHDRTPLKYRIETALETNHWRLAASEHGRSPGLVGTLNTPAVNGESFPDGFVPSLPDSRARAKQPSNDFLVDTWQADDGLPENSVLSIAQTRDGYLWVATDDGLARFDGVRFVSLRPPGDQGSATRQILTLYGDRHGALWIGTRDARVFRWENDRLAPVPLPLPARGAVSFAEDAAGHLWAGADNGLYRWENSRFVPASTALEQPTIPHARVFADATGRLWLSQNSGLRSVSSEGALSPVIQGTAGIQDVRLSSRGKGGLWVADVWGELFTLSPEGVLQHARKSLLPNASSCLLHEDRSGNLWVGDYGHGLVRVAPDGTLEYFAKDRGLAGNFITTLFEDREGNLWVGAGGGGLSRLKHRAFRVFDGQDGLARLTVHTVCEGANGDMFFGSAGDGLCRLRQGRLFRLAAEKNLNYVWALQPDPAGNLWTGTFGQGLFHYEMSEPVRYALLTVHNITSLLASPAGNLWAAAPDHGLLSFHGENVRLFSTADGLSDSSPCALAQDDRGGLWVGTLGGALDYFYNGNFRHYGKEEGLPGAPVWSLFLDAAGRLWIGTRGGGLLRFDGDRFTRYTTSNGLHDNVICGIMEDGADNLWMSSFQGVFRVARHELEDVAAGITREIHSSAFGVEDGLNTRECSGGSQPTVCRSSDGRLWFATSKGLAVLNPSEIIVNTNPPPVVIEELILDGRLLGGSESNASALVIPPDNARLDIHFTALSLTSPQKNRFRYRMKNFDRDWVEAGHERLATYTRLPPGLHRFQVIAANNDGVWNETGASILLRVQPHFWQTGWFLALLALAAAGSAYAAHLRSILKIERDRAAQAVFARQLIATQELERKRIAGELHDGLAQNLMVIRNQALLALGDAPAPSSRHLDQIRDSASLAIEEVRTIATNLRPFHLDRLGLTHALEFLIETIESAAAIEIESGVDNLDGLFPAEFEINLYRILQEALNNIWKHSGASKAVVEFKRQPKSLLVLVSDDGRGFDSSLPRQADPQKPSFGLTGIQERVKIMGGVLEITARPGEGTRLFALIPLPWAAPR